MLKVSSWVSCRCQQLQLLPDQGTTPDNKNWTDVSNSYQNQQKQCRHTLLLDISSNTGDGAMEPHSDTRKRHRDHREQS